MLSLITFIVSLLLANRIRKASLSELLDSVRSCGAYARGKERPGQRRHRLRLN